MIEYNTYHKSLDANNWGYTKKSVDDALNNIIKNIMHGWKDECPHSKDDIMKIIKNEMGE
jgi:hypothetical protein